jgi:hypothetical protein
MGGPLNGGVPGYIKLGDNVRELSGILIPTLIQTSADLLEYISSLTCLYDVNWVPEFGRVTLPISMFHVTGIHEIGKTNVSTKRVILYEPQSSDSAAVQANQVRPSVLRAITDNAVRDPKQYTLDIVLPFSPVDRSMESFAGMVGGALTIFSSMLGLDTFSDYVSQYLGTAYQYSVGLVNDALQILNQLPSSNDFAYLNKNSLDSMWEKTHFLVMKMWTGLDYKFVLITDIDISKKPTEDDVFRGSLRVQEMPVLCVNKPSGSTTASIPNPVEAPLSGILAKVTGVDQFYPAGGIS